MKVFRIRYVENGSWTSWQIVTEPNLPGAFAVAGEGVDSFVVEYVGDQEE